LRLDDHTHQTDASVPTGDLPDFLLCPFYALGRDPELAVQEEPMAEELAFPGLEKAPNDAKEALVADPARNWGHQDIVIHPVEGTHDTLPIVSTFPNG